MAIISVLTDNKNVITKTIDKDLNKTAAEHIVKGHGETLDIKLNELPNLIQNLTPHQCLCLGYHRDGKYNIDKYSGDVARTKEYFTFSSKPSFILFDFDKVNMTIEAAVGFLESLDPNLIGCGYVAVYSSSSFLYSLDGEELVGGTSFHIYYEVSNGEFIQRYGDTLFDRAFLKGFGKIKVIKNTGAKGRRTLFDATVWNQPNREIFESNPVCLDIISKRLDKITIKEGNQLDIEKAFKSIELNPSEIASLRLIVHKLRTSEEVETKSQQERKNGEYLRAKIRVKHNPKSNFRAEISEQSQVMEWYDSNNVFHTCLASNDFIMTEDGTEVQVLEILTDAFDNFGENWKNKSLPDPTDPYKRGNEKLGIPGKGIAYCRYNEDDGSMKIYSFYGNAEYHLIWTLAHISNRIENGFKDNKELSVFMDHIFNSSKLMHCLSAGEIDTIAKTYKTKSASIYGASKYGTDLRVIKPKLRENCFTLPKSAIPDFVDRINAHHGICLVGGKAKVIMENYKDKEGIWVPSYADLEALSKVDAEKLVMLGDKAVCEFQAWNKNHNKNKYTGETFSPNSTTIRPPFDTNHVIQQGGEYNLWQGFIADMTRATTCDKILWHIENIWCSGHPVMYDYVLTWISKLFQEPARVGMPYLVLGSKEGAGKNVIIDDVIGKLLGCHAITSPSVEDIIGKFNEHLRYNVFVFLDEAFYAGDPRTTGALKSLINKKRMYEKKGIDKEHGTNHSKIMMASNEQFIAHVGAQDRRYVYPNVSNKKVGDMEYFGALMNEIENGGKEAFLKYMLEYKTDTDVIAIPKSGHSNQRSADQLQSAGGAVRAVIDLIVNGSEQYKNVPGVESFGTWDDKGEIILRKETIYNIVIAYCDKWRIKRNYQDPVPLMMELSKWNHLYANNNTLAHLKDNFCLAVKVVSGRKVIRLLSRRECAKLLNVELE